MIPKYLRLEGFLSYCEPAELDFTMFDLACISGSNGAGKSSLLDAITWVLFGQARRRDDAIINHRSKVADVVLEFDYEGACYRVQRIKPRDKPTVLEFQIQGENGQWRPLTERTLRDTETRIQQTLHMDYDTFINSSFFLQGKADSFAQQRPADRKRILGNILNLDIWETYKEEATTRRKAAETDMSILDNRISELQQELDQETLRREELEKLEELLVQASKIRLTQEKTLDNLRRLASSLEEQSRMVNLLENQVHNARQRHDETRSLLEERQAELVVFHERLDKASEIESAYQDWQQERIGLERWELLAKDFRQYEAQRSGPLLVIETERARLEQEKHSLADLEEQIKSISLRIPELENALQEKLSHIQEYESQLSNRLQMETDLRSCQESTANLAAENKRLKTEMDELKERIDQLKQTSGSTCALCGQPLDDAGRIALIADLETRGREMGDSYRANLDLTRKNGEASQEAQQNLIALKQVEEKRNFIQRDADLQTSQMEQYQLSIDEWKQNRLPRMQEIDRLLLEEAFAAEARKELKKVDEMLFGLGYDAAAHDLTRKKELEGRSSEMLFRELEAARAAMVPLEREIHSLQEKAELFKGDINKTEGEYQQAFQKYQAEAADLPDLNQAEQELNDLQERENHLRMQVGAASQAVEVLKNLQTRLVEFQDQRKTITSTVALLRTLERAFGKDGVPALLIEQALPDLEAQANDILDRLTAGAMTIRFATQRDYRDRNRDDKKETLDILISDSAGMREYEMFSGGEAFRVNFAIRLALSRTLAQRSGARLQTLVIDEGFGSQDAEGRQRLIEAINLVRLDFSKILVITHLEELKDAFPTRIEIGKTPSGSSLKVVI